LGLGPVQGGAPPVPRGAGPDTMLGRALKSPFIFEAEAAGLSSIVSLAGSGRLPARDAVEPIVPCEQRWSRDRLDGQIADTIERLRTVIDPPHLGRGLCNLPNTGAALFPEKLQAWLDVPLSAGQA